MSHQSLLNKIKSSPAGKRLAGMLPHKTKAALRRTLDSVSGPSKLDLVLAQASQTNDLLALMVYEQARMTPRFLDKKRLLGDGFKVYSQHDEDGVIEGIFRRIGVTNRYFIEFGVGDGLENCTTYLLLQEWSGLWIDGSAYCHEQIQVNLRPFLESKQLQSLYSFITAENIESLFASQGVPEEFDFLSIDIDRNDYWVWEAIQRYRPRVVAIEYNASFKQTVSCVIPYDGSAIWNGTSYFGASLKALELLGRKKGYALVGCNFTGVTAFFVRGDCLGDRFAEPYTSENHYEPPRYFVRMPNGHRAAFGPTIHPGA